MTSNLDRSLDEILASRPRTGRRGRGTSSSATSGGIRKRPQRAAAQKATASVAPNAAKTAAKPKVPLSATKIIVSNLPYDVTEQMIKDYFQQVVGPIRRAVITYGPDGRSRGVATVEFNKAEDAAVAAQKYNGVEVDKRPMKVELVVDPNAPPTFAERVGQPNKLPAPKPADKPKPVTKQARGGRRGRGRGGASGSGRKPKTAEQLDQEMADYFDSSSSAPATTTAAPAAATNGDVGMDDNVL